MIAKLIFKITIISILLFFSLNSKAQTSYLFETNAFSTSMKMYKDTIMDINIIVVKDSIFGTEVYSEQHPGTSINGYGLFSINIGNGNNASGILPNLDQSTDTEYFIKTLINGELSLISLYQSYISQ